MPHWSLARPAASTQLMIRVAREHGVPERCCIAGTGLTADDLTDPAREIAGGQELAVLRNILGAVGPNVPFGLEAGLQYRITAQGAWGLAILASGSMREAIEVGFKYFDLTDSFNRPRFELTPDEVRFFYDPSDNPEDLRQALIERDMGALLRMERDVLGESLPVKRLQFRTRRVPYANVFAQHFGIEPQWEAEVDALVRDASVLDITGPLADRLAFRVSEQMCSELIQKRRASGGFAGQVRARILRQPGHVPSMQAVSAELGMSARTLRNRLQLESTSFREVLTGARQELAEQLLDAGLSLDAIAEHVGYADTSSFISAFKRWKGVAPGAYRAQRELD